MKNLISILLILFLVSCSVDEYDAGTFSANRIDETGYNNLVFAQGIAKSLVNPEIRAFLKEEALKEVDNDFDVIYALVKDRELKSGKSFRETISGYMGGIKRLDSIAKLDPTLTIAIPYLSNKTNVETWDTSTEIPKLVYRDHFTDKKQKELLGFDCEGNSFKMLRYTKPDRLTLVVKSNERLLASPKMRSLKSSAYKPLIDDSGDVVAYFVDDEFSHNTFSNLKANQVVVGWEKVTEFENNIYLKAVRESPDSPRDYIYYGISTKNNVTLGRLNTTYKEYITSIQFNSTESYTHVADLDDRSQAADWSDGNLEIVFDFLFLTKEEVISKVTKMISVRIKDLFYSGKTLTYNLPNPIEVFNWDMYKYGSTFKIIVSEYDPGTATERVESTSTTISHNWQVDTSGGFGSIWKVGAKYNGSHTDVKTQSTKINFTNNSDPLGEILVDFFNPISLNKTVKVWVKFSTSHSSTNWGTCHVIKDINDIVGIRSFINECLDCWPTYPAKKIELEYDLIYHKSNTGMVSLGIRPIKIG